MGQTGGTLARSLETPATVEPPLASPPPRFGPVEPPGRVGRSRPSVRRDVRGPGRDPRGARGNGGCARPRGRALDQICMLGARVSILVLAFKATLGRALAATEE
jgi:hypothetical protein